MDVKRLANLPGHQNPVYAVESSTQQDFFYTAGNDKGVVQWSLQEPAFIKVLMPVTSSVYALHIPVDQSVIISGERSGQTSFYNFEEQRVAARLSHHSLPVFAVGSIAKKNEMIAASEDGTASITDLGTLTLVYRFRISEHPVRCLAISPDESIVAFGCKDNRIRIYSCDDYSFLGELDGHSMPVTSLSFSPDGILLLSGGRDAKLNIWNVRDFTLKEGITAHMFAVYDIKFHAYLPYFATCSQDKSIKIWSSDDFKLLKIISREKGIDSHSHSVNKLTWNTKNGSLISVSDDRMVMLWDLQ